MVTTAILIFPHAWDGDCLGSSAGVMPRAAALQEAYVLAVTIKPRKPILESGVGY